MNRVMLNTPTALKLVSTSSPRGRVRDVSRSVRRPLDDITKGVKRFPTTSVLCRSAAVSSVDNTPEFPESRPVYRITDTVVTIGALECRVFSPDDVSSRVGTVLFLSGFAQSPDAYEEVLSRCAQAGVVVLAPRTPTLSTSPERLQTRILDEGQFWIEHAMDVEDAQSEQLHKWLPTSKAHFGVFGHSVGGGLAFALAERFPEVKLIAAMAPASSDVEGLGASSVIRGAEFQSTSRRVLVLSGGLDVVAPRKQVFKEVISPLQEELGVDAVQTEFFPLGFHTSFSEFLEIPLERVVAEPLHFVQKLLGGPSGPQAKEDIATRLEGATQFLAIGTFLSGVTFAIAVLGALYFHGVESEKAWLAIGSSWGIGTIISVVTLVELVKGLRGQLDRTSETAAKFFVEGFESDLFQE